MAEELLVGGRRVALEVRRSRRARRARIVVRSHRAVEVVLPERASAGAAQRLLRAERRWLERAVAAAEARARAGEALGLGRPGVVWLHARPVPVQRRGGRARAVLSSGGVIVGGEPAAAGRAVERWYRREARRRIGALCEAEARRLGLRHGSLAIRDPRTRWGSCSSSGALSFSWRLLLAPEEVLRYVVVHELCHLRHPHHGPAFWAAVEDALPGWRDSVRWLRQHGGALLAYVPLLDA